MCQTVSHDNYTSISNLIPELTGFKKEQSVIIPQSVMDCKVTVKQKGVSVMSLEIAFCTVRNGEYVSDHSMRVKLNHIEKTAEPESVWFRCRGSTKVKIPKVGVDMGILKVQQKTLKTWLEQIHPVYVQG